MRFLFGRGFARLVALAGVAIVAGAGLWAKSVDDRRAGFARAEGTVIDHAKVRHAAGERFHPRIEFRTSGGEIVRVTGRVGAAEPSPEKGARVRILYIPADPAGARVDSWREHWLGPAALGFVGAAFLALGLAAARFAAGRAGPRPPAPQ